MKTYTQTLTLALLLTFVASGFQNLRAQSDGEVVNLGLYGGMAIDLSYCNTNQRLFAGVNTPGSIFYTDDNGANWTQPFPVDSLEYANGQRGWGGGAVRVLTNSQGWVAARTAQQGGTLTAAVISYSEGDALSFHTAMDKYLLQQINPAYNANSVTGMGLSDHYQYIGLEQYLTRVNDTSTSGNHNVVTRTDTITGIGTNYRILDIAIANQSSGYPIYLILGTSWNDGGNLYRFDGASFTLLTVTAIPHKVERIFTHPAQITGDTLIASIRQTGTNVIQVFLSEDAGVSWTNITPSGGTNWPLHSADYSSSWVAGMPISNGLQLSFPGGGVSNDLGASWTSHVLPDNSMATHPTDLLKVFGSYGRGVAMSTTGPEGPFNITDNEGLAAVGITKIARSGGVYYVSTNAGLGYTNAYFDETVDGPDKWNAPYGEFPIPGVGDDGGVSAVAMSQTDPLHIVAGHNNGFSVSFTGPAGFSQVTPSGWNTSANFDARVTDLTFVNNNIIVAVTGSGSNVLQFPSSPYGNIWRSDDGGLSWSIVTPTGFEQGNTIEVGSANNDTVIYAGTGYFDMNFPNVDGAIWKSDDLGLTWSFVNDGPTGLGSGTLRMPVYDIDIDPRYNDTIYIASGQNLDYAMVQSFDGGFSFNYTAITPHGAFSSVLVDTRNPDVVSCGARRNVFRLNTITGVIDTTFFGLPGEFVPDLENGSTLIGSSTGFYKVVEDFGADTSFWNGTGNWSEQQWWNNGVPQYLSNAVIESGHATVDNAFEVNAILVEPLSKLTLSASGALSLNAPLTLTSNETGSASFINQRTDDFTLHAVVESNLTTGKWHQVSPSLSDATASAYLSVEDGSAQLVEYVQSTNSWVTIDNPDQPLTAAKGYAVYYESGNNAETAQGEGMLNKGDQTANLEYSGNGFGWNLIGNPFPSAIDWNQGDWNFNLTTMVMYVYKDGNYLARNVFGHGTFETGIIPSGQGFFVQATANGASISIPENACVHDHTPVHKQSQTFDQVLDISLSVGDKSDETWLGFDAAATDNYDNSWDAIRFDGEADMPKLFTKIGMEPATINMMGPVGSKRNVPLYVVPAEDGLYTLDFAYTESFATDTLVLLDQSNGYEQDLKENAVYTFEAAVGDDPERFVLKFNPEAVSVNESHSSDYLIFSRGDELVIRLGETHPDKLTIRLTDLNGIMLGEYVKNGSGNLSVLSCAAYRGQLVLVQLIDQKGVSVTKVFIP